MIQTSSSSSSFQLPNSSFIEWLIIFFCVFHIAAITLYALPDVDPGFASAQVRQAFLPLIQPYLFTTSQWQQWNLFSPDPTQRVTNYTVEARTGPAWTEIALIAPDALPRWRMADEMKLIGTLESNSHRALRVPYLEQYCSTLRLPTRTPLRMLSHFAIISREHPMTPQDWLTTLYAETTCP